MGSDTERFVASSRITLIVGSSPGIPIPVTPARVRVSAGRMMLSSTDEAEESWEPSVTVIGARGVAAGVFAIMVVAGKKR